MASAMRALVFLTFEDQSAVILVSRTSSSNATELTRLINPIHQFCIVSPSHQFWEAPHFGRQILGGTLSSHSALFYYSARSHLLVIFF